MAEHIPSKVRAWVLAARPKTLPAAVMPVLIGSAVACHDGVFRFLPAFVALLCSLLIQIGTNYSNDLLDYKSGADTDDRLGPARAVASRWISEQEMYWGTLITFGATVPLGLYLIAVAGWPVLVIGLFSISAGIAYTGGPYPLAYNGLGDPFVFLFFGLVATIGTYFVQAQSVTLVAVLAALPAGGLITNILVINNYRDIETDKQTKKHTLAVILGKGGTRIEYLSLLCLSYMIPVVLVLAGFTSWWVLLPWISLPLGIRIVVQLYRGSQGLALNPLLEKTAQLSLIYGILFSLGLVL